MKQYAGRFWIAAFATLAVSLAGLIGSHALQLPGMVGWSFGMAAVASVGAIAALEIKWPLQ